MLLLRHLERNIAGRDDTAVGSRFLLRVARVGGEQVCGWVGAELRVVPSLRCYRHYIDWSVQGNFRDRAGDRWGHAQHLVGGWNHRGLVRMLAKRKILINGWSQRLVLALMV